MSLLCILLGERTRTVTEVAYLRKTGAPDMHQCRRVKLDGDRFKCEKFTVAEMRTSIQNAVEPERDLSQDVNQLLKAAF